VKHGVKQTPFSAFDQPGAIIAKFHGLLFDGGDCTSCIFHQTGIAAFAMGKAKTMTHFMDGNLRQQVFLV
jgi:hypothetical protein